MLRRRCRVVVGLGLDAWLGDRGVVFGEEVDDGVGLDDAAVAPDTEYLGDVDGPSAGARLGGEEVEALDERAEGGGVDGLMEIGEEFLPIARAEVNALGFGR